MLHSQCRIEHRWRLISGRILEPVVPVQRRRDVVGRLDRRSRTEADLAASAESARERVNRAVVHSVTPSDYRLRSGLEGDAETRLDLLRIDIPEAAPSEPPRTFAREHHGTFQIPGSRIETIGFKTRLLVARTQESSQR